MNVINVCLCIHFARLDDNCSPWMIFEFMAYGDLTEVLRNSSDQFTNYSAHLPSLDIVSANKFVNYV